MEIKSDSTALQRWDDVKALLGNERMEFGPYFTYIVRHSPRRLLHLLSYYKFAAKMIGAKKRVLEIGCNEGFGSILLAERATSVLGVDIDAEAIATANASVASDVLQFRCADVLSEELGQYDAVVALDVIEHISKDHEDAFMGRIAQMLGPRGIAIIGTPNITSDQYASPVTRIGHINLFSAERLAELAERKFGNAFLFSANDEMVHTGFSPLAHYLIALCVGPR